MRFPKGLQQRHTLFVMPASRALSKVDLPARNGAFVLLPALSKHWQRVIFKILERQLAHQIFHRAVLCGQSQRSKIHSAAGQDELIAHAEQPESFLLTGTEEMHFGAFYEVRLALSLP